MTQFMRPPVETVESARKKHPFFRHSAAADILGGRRERRELPGKCVFRALFKPLLYSRRDAGNYVANGNWLPPARLSRKPFILLIFCISAVALHMLRRTSNVLYVAVGGDDPRQSEEPPRRIVGMNGEADAELRGQRRHLAEEEPQVVPHVVLREAPVGRDGLPERVESECVRGAVLRGQSR